MGIIGILIFIVMLAIFLYTVSAFIDFSRGFFNKQFKAKSFLIFLFGFIVLIVTFNLTVYFANDLGIQTACPNEAPNCNS